MLAALHWGLMDVQAGGRSMNVGLCVCSGAEPYQRKLSFHPTCTAPDSWLSTVL